MLPAEPSRVELSCREGWNGITVGKFSNNYEELEVQVDVDNNQDDNNQDDNNQDDDEGPSSTLLLINERTCTYVHVQLSSVGCLTDFSFLPVAMVIHLYRWMDGLGVL